MRAKRKSKWATGLIECFAPVCCLFALVFTFNFVHVCIITSVRPSIEFRTNTFNSESSAYVCPPKGATPFPFS